jgi:stearoyl-CoA desaturase (delta-9 desaturase)
MHEENMVIQKSEHIGLVKLRIVLLHLGALSALYYRPTLALLLLATASFLIRCFGVEVGLHRYFAHRSYKTSRIFQFVLALLGAAGGFRGPLWWADVHRRHHVHADQQDDPHSPIRSAGYAHLLWVFDPRNQDTDLSRSADFSRYPELVWLNRRHYLIPYGYMGLLFCAGHFGLFGPQICGMQALVWGFFVSGAMLLHSIFMVNSLCHGVLGESFGSRRFNTRDRSRNSLLLALFTCGGSWHNNHHRYPLAARAGFYAHEVDLGYYALWVLERLGIVWALQAVPRDVLENGAGDAALET